ncbi:MAG: hypothetical protein WCJ61_10340 [Paludibacter sp.]
MNKIKNYINNFLFKKRAQNYLSTSEREHRFVSYDKAKSVLILFESDYNEKNPFIRRIIQSLQQDGKKVSAWGFIDKKEITSAILPDFRILHHQQTDFFHKPDPAFFRELENLQFDLLIDLSLQLQLPLEYLAMYANAYCKTGLKKTDLPIYDFMLDMESLKSATEEDENPIDEIYLYNQIIFYLKSIQTTD